MAPEMASEAPIATHLPRTLANTFAPTDSTLTIVATPRWQLVPTRRVHSLYADLSANFYANFATVSSRAESVSASSEWRASGTISRSPVLASH